MNILEVDMFSSNVSSPEHPVADSFRELLEEVADQYNCRLQHFEVHEGAVSFSFDSEELMANILKILQEKEEK
jgi:hypothetical protein